MKLLLDTHIVIWLIQNRIAEKVPHLRTTLELPENLICISVVSIWEIAIKQELGKLPDALMPHSIAPLVRAQGLLVLNVTEEHAAHRLDPLPPTRDPFDRLLLAQAQAENMRFVTIDRALADHPVTFR